MKIYNSLTDKLEEFKPINEGCVNIYYCGPTVYNYVHIGNMRPVMTFDMVYKYFKYLGYKVTMASNFTDINPKIIKAAADMGITEREVANKFIKAYLDDVKSYNCNNMDYRPNVLENLDNIYEFIKALIDKDFAYEKDGNVYFRVRKVKDYGILSNQDILELEAGSRVEVDENKEDPLDFALWRKTTEGERFNSPWGEGIPGWHTECVVMINSLFKDKIDIHGGGVDLKFPHHENEIAQSMALYNHHLANYWMHNGHINVDGEKMSKSLGNFILAKDFIKLHKPNIIKLALFKTHYRLPLNFTDALFEEAKTIDDKIMNALKGANSYKNINDLEFNLDIKDKEFENIMNNDFNTPNAITYLLELVKNLNNEIRNKGNNIIDLASKILVISDVLGLVYDLPVWDEEDKQNYKLWQQARSEKDFTKADYYRDILTKRNIL